MDARLPLLLSLLLVLPAADAHEDDEEVTITTHSGDGDFWFECSGAVCGTGRNPTLTLEAGHTYQFVVQNDDNVGHDFNLGGAVGEGSAFLNAGESDTFEVTVPSGASGEAEYWCNPHRSAGMVGTVVFESAAGDDNGSPGLGAVALVAALGGALLVARRR